MLSEWLVRRSILLRLFPRWGVRRSPRLVLTACFALNPMILLYAGNGMGEGLYVFTLIASTRYLLRWIHQGDLRSLAYSGVALACSYLCRYESVGSLALANSRCCSSQLVASRREPKSEDQDGPIGIS